MRIVLDTNVLVSGLLNPLGAPGRVLDLILAGELRLLVDDRILYEYADVLGRRRFSLDAGLVDALLGLLRRRSESVLALPLAVELPDPDDLPWLEVAVSGVADALVTGNRRHFPRRAAGAVRVLSPAGFLRGLVSG